MQAGQTIHVQAPDGRLNAIIIPPGFGPGSTFTVEFAPEQAAAAAATNNHYTDSRPPPLSKPEQSSYASSAANPYNNPYPPQPNYYPTTTATTTTSSSSPQPPPPTYHGDDGFVSGFNNPNYVPPSAPAQAVSDPYDYPVTATATPMTYPSAPQYPSK